jgi:hypothetical protein
LDAALAIVIVVAVVFVAVRRSPPPAPPDADDADVDVDVLAGWVVRRRRNNAGSKAATHDALAKIADMMRMRFVLYNGLWCGW